MKKDIQHTNKTNKQDKKNNKQNKTYKTKTKEQNRTKGQIHHKIFRMNIHRSEDRLEDGIRYRVPSRKQNRSKTAPSER